MKLPNASVERVAANFQSVELGDPRREKRLVKTVAKLAARPSVSFPEAMGSSADEQGGYRLVNNPHVTLDALLEAQSGATAARARAAGPVIAIHDTTPCRFPNADPAEVGYLNTGKAGFNFHYSLVVDGKEMTRPLGIPHGEALFRKRPPRRRSKNGRRRSPPGSKTAGKKDREYLRWMRGIARTEETLAGCEVIHVADRESDSSSWPVAAKPASALFFARGFLPASSGLQRQ